MAPAVSTVAETIQLVLAPVFLLAGIGAILNVLAGRAARVVDRSRELEKLHPASTGPEHDRHVWELRIVARRITLVSGSIFLIVASAVAVCMLVALLFIAQLADLQIGNAVAIVFVVAMALLVAALALFLVEVTLAFRTIRVRREPARARPVIEKRLLQVVVALACVVPLSVGGLSVVAGPGWLGGVSEPVPTDLDSHFRYISGIFLALGLAFASCIPRLEAMGARFRLLTAMVVIGGLARLWSLLEVGVPSEGHLLGLAMELLVVPLIALWREGMARRYRAGSAAGPGSSEAA